MKIRILAAILAAVATPLSAQSVEQSYADQCANGEVNETCAVLRAAMLEKLSRQNGDALGADIDTVQSITVPQWGLFLDLMKQRHVYILGKGMRDMAYESPIVTYSWKEPGEIILVASELPGGPNVETTTLHWDRSQGAIIETAINGGAEAALLPQSDGSFVAEIGQVRISYRKSPHGVEQAVEAKSATGWDLLWKYDLVPFTPESLGVLRQIHENNISVAKINASIPAKYHDPEYLRQAQEEERQRQARKKSNGGLFGALVGAAVGAYAGSAAGMDAGQTADLMMRGAAVASGNSGVAQGFANGLAEETAKNEAMEQSMRNAANEGLVRGAAEYARKQEQAARDTPSNNEGAYSRGALVEEGNGSGTGDNRPRITIEDSSKTVASPQGPGEPGTRQTYAWCMALRPNQSATYSTVQQITIPYRGWSDSSMRESFGATSGGGVSICSNADSRAAAQTQLDDSRTGHRGIKQTTTSTILRP